MKKSTKQSNDFTIDWHRAFGMAIKGCVSEYGYRVETEIDVSQQKQLLDLIVIRQNEVRSNQTVLCDGFDNFARYNLISYKSLHESFNQFTAEELYSYYVNYSKLPEQRNLKLSREDYQLYGIATKLPEKLLETVSYKIIKPGVYDLDTGLKPIRLLVLSALEQKVSNAILHLFSNRKDKFKFGYEHIDQAKFNTKKLPVINRIIELYQAEELDMPYTEEQFLEDYQHDVFKRVYAGMTPEEKITGLKDSLKPEEILGSFKLEERLHGLKPEEIKKYLDSLS